MENKLVEHLLHQYRVANHGKNRRTYTSPDNRFTIEIATSEGFANGKPTSMMAAWVRNGYLEKPLPKYFSVSTDYLAADGGYYGWFNPQHRKDRHMLNFAYVLEANPENEHKIVFEAVRMREEEERVWIKRNPYVNGMVCQFVGGIFDSRTFSVREVEVNLCNGLHTEDLSHIRANGGFTHSPLLDNLPMVSGYLSPMLDGGRFRYETYEVYERLSR